MEILNGAVSTASGSDCAHTTHLYTTQSYKLGGVFFGGSRLVITLSFEGRNLVGVFSWIRVCVRGRHLCLHLVLRSQSAHLTCAVYQKCILMGNLDVEFVMH